MNRKRKYKLIGVLCILVFVALAAALILFALKQNINLFYLPSQLQTASLRADQSIRVGGFVKKDSVQFDKSGQAVRFVITDKNAEIAVDYRGILPNLFREGQGVVVTGKIENHTLEAQQVLAKHDEKYMPWALGKSLTSLQSHSEKVPGSPRELRSLAMTKDITQQNTVKHDS